ncbi:unnamed protein product [Caenorhabditis brenneri]
MLVQGWTLLAFTCLLIAICLADTSASKLEEIKSQELEAPNKADKVTELKTGKELEGLETRYDRFGRVFQIPFGRVSGVFKAVAQVVSASEEKIDGNKKSSSPKTMMAPKDQSKDGDVEKSVKKDGKEGGHGSGTAAGFGSRKGASGSTSVPSTSPKPKTTEPVPKSDGKTGNKSPNGGPRASKIDKKPEVSEKKKVGMKEEEGTPKDTTIGPNPKAKSDGEKRIESSKPNKIQFGQPRAPKSGEKVGVDKTKSTISTGGKGDEDRSGTEAAQVNHGQGGGPVPKSKNERKTWRKGGSRASKIGDKKNERKNAGKKNGEGSNHNTVGKEGGPSPLGPGTRKTSVPDEPSPITPDTSFASGNIRSSSDSSPSTTTAAPKKRRKGKKRQEWWSVPRLLLNVASNLTGVLLCSIIHFKWYRVLSPSKSERAGTNESDAGKGPSENKDKNLNEPLPPLDEASARKRKELILMYVVGFEKWRALEKKVKAEHKSDNRTAKFRKMGPIFIPRESANPPAEGLPGDIVIEKIIYVPDDNEEWIIGSNIDEIEFDESYHIESDLLDHNAAPAPTAPLPPAAPTTTAAPTSTPPPPPAGPASTALPTPSLATTGTPEPSKETRKTTDADEKKEEMKNTN